MAGTWLDSPNLPERYAVLLELARVLASAFSPSGPYAAIHAHVSRVLPATSFAIYTAGAGGELLEAYRHGPATPDPPTPAEMANLGAGDFVLRSDPEGGSTIIAPLLSGDRFIGCMIARRRIGRPFDAPDAHFLIAAGRLAGAAIENARLYHEARKRGEEAEQLEELARELAGSLDIDAVVRRVARRVHELVGAPTVVWVADGRRIRAVASAGGAGVRTGEERPLSPAEAVRLLRSEPATEPGAGAGAGGSTAQLVTRDDVANYTGAPDGAEAVLLPLRTGERLVGVIGIGPCAAAPDPQRMRLVRRFAPHAATAIENARLHTEVRMLSLTDPLVQLPNRRQLDAYLEREFAAARRGRPLCLVLFDLDRFKDYNDAYGHHEGDLALIRFADVLRKETRAMNLVARYGGEEFAAVLSGTRTVGGRIHAERVRRRVEEEFGGRLTISAGVAGYVDSMKSPTDLIIAADRALYRAKIEGRNRVCVTRP